MQKRCILHAVMVTNAAESSWATQYRNLGPQCESQASNLCACLLAGDVTFADLVAALKKKGTVIKGTGNTIGYAAQDDSGKLAPYRYLACRSPAQILADTRVPD